MSIYNLEYLKKLLESLYTPNPRLPSLLQEEADYIIFSDDPTNPKTYYAKNGRTGVVEKSDSDAATVIQYAVDKIAGEYSGGGEIYISAGLYILKSKRILTGNIYSAVVISGSNIKIRGAGRDKTWLRLDNNMQSNVFAANNVNHIEICDLSIDGNKANNTDTTVDGGQNGILFLTGGFGHTIKNVRVQNMTQNGIYVAATQSMVYIENVIVENNGYHGLVLDASIYFDVISVKALNNNLSGIYISVDIVQDFIGKIIGGFFYNNNFGIYIYNARGVIIEGAKALNNKVDGILVQNSEDVDLVGVAAYENGRNGIYVLSSKKIKVLGGFMRNNHQDPAQPMGAGVRIQDSTRCIINGVAAYDDQTVHTQGPGIEEAGASDYNIITNNIAYGNLGVSQIYKVGVNTIVANNITL